MSIQSSPNHKGKTDLAKLPSSDALLYDKHWQRLKTIYEKHNHDTAENFRYQFNIAFSNIDFSGLDVLEVGCGKGFLSLWISLFTKARSVTALDESEGHGADDDVLEILRANVALFQLADRLDVVQTDVLTHKGKQYDLIIANNCLHHFLGEDEYFWRDKDSTGRYEKMFEHFASLLPKNGTLVIQEIDPLNFWRWASPKIVFPDTDWRIHPPLKWWLMAMRAGGFDIVAVKTGIMFKLRQFRKILSNPFARFFMRGTVFIYTVKSK